MAASIEKTVRNFVRSQFSARIKKVDGEYQTSVSKKGARMMIQNPATVLANLLEMCGKPVEEKGNTTTFKIKKTQNTVSLIQNADNAVLVLTGSVE